MSQRRQSNLFRIGSNITKNLLNITKHLFIDFDDKFKDCKYNFCKIIYRIQKNKKFYSCLFLFFFLDDQNYKGPEILHIIKI